MGDPEFKVRDLIKRENVRIFSYSYALYGDVSRRVVALGERLWRDGFRYAKCGVMIMELLLETIRRPALQDELDRERRERAQRAMDKLNATFGRDAVRILGAGPKEAA